MVANYVGCVGALCVLMNLYPEIQCLLWLPSVAEGEQGGKQALSTRGICCALFADPLQVSIIFANSGVQPVTLQESFG